MTEPAAIAKSPLFNSVTVDQEYEPAEKFTPVVFVAISPISATRLATRLRT